MGLKEDLDRLMNMKTERVLPPARTAPNDDDAETRALLAELEQELGVRGTAAVFRKALLIAKAARTDAEREFGPLGEW